MQYLIDAGILLGSYILGSIPFGLIVVKIISGKDIRSVASGRTGGTNAMRAAGLWAGVLTAIFDVLKAAAPVWLAQAITSNLWMHAITPIAVILGNNYSIFLVDRDEDGNIRLRGGAGGAATGGGAFGLWPPAVLILIPIGLMVWYGIGYASITTLSIGLVTISIFVVRAALGLSPWEYIVYGILAESILIWALRPNIKRLIAGTERRHGLPARLLKRRQVKDTKEPN